MLREVADFSGVKRAIEQNSANVGTDLLRKFRLCTDPQNIHLVVAGGDHPSRSCVIPSWTTHGNREVALPDNWEQLLYEADRDLGPLQD